jgi:Na+-transporting NADH:ubiquinone oxidoreductase subunit C
MNTNTNSYTLIYATVIVVIVALLLAIVSGGLKSRQNENVAIDRKKQIISSLRLNLEKQDVTALYDKYIAEEWVINADAEIISDRRGDAFAVDVIKETAKPLADRRLPVYVANVDGQTKYIITVRGAGLWGPIWGYVALDDDKNTVYGTYFSHAGETPGLGAEISTPKFQETFTGKHILNNAGEFVSIAVMKAGQTADGKEQVDAISGGTITSKGVETMLLNSIAQYEKFLKSENKGETEE